MLSSFHQNNKCRLCNLPYRLAGNHKNVELLNLEDNNMIYSEIHSKTISQQKHIAQQTDTKRKGKVGVELSFAPSFQQPFSFIECMPRVYLIIYHYLLYSTIQQNTMVKLAVINLTPVSVTAA